MTELKIHIPKYTKYNHHGCDVTVLTKNKGKHRDNCLCFDCKMWWGCTVRKKLYAMCVQYNFAAPVWECKSFESKGE